MNYRHAPQGSACFSEAVYTMIKVDVIGASGYMGAEAVRVLHGHPAVELAGVTAHSQAGKTFCQLPQTKAVMGSNFCDLAVRVDHRTKRIVVPAVIDNLVKGAPARHCRI